MSVWTTPLINLRDSRTPLYSISYCVHLPPTCTPKITRNNGFGGQVVFSLWANMYSILIVLSVRNLRNNLVHFSCINDKETED